MPRLARGVVVGPKGLHMRRGPLCKVILCRVGYAVCPVASARANPRTACVKQAARIAGLREVASIRAAKMVPIPTPAPIRPIAARPAPMYFADCIANKYLLGPHQDRRDCINILRLPLTRQHDIPLQYLCLCDMLTRTSPKPNQINPLLTLAVPLQHVPLLTLYTCRTRLHPPTRPTPYNTTLDYSSLSYPPLLHCTCTPASPLHSRHNKIIDNS